MENDQAYGNHESGRHWQNGCRERGAEGGEHRDEEAVVGLPDNEVPGVAGRVVGPKAKAARAAHTAAWGGYGGGEEEWCGVVRGGAVW